MGFSHVIRFSGVAIFAALLIGPTVGECHAAIVFDNLGQSNAGPSNGLLVGNSIKTGDQAIQLTSIVVAQTSIEAGLGYVPEESIFISGRNPDGTVGDLLSVIPSADISFDATTRYATATFDTPFLLQANTGYWILLSSNVTTLVGWDYTASSSYTAPSGVTIPADLTSLQSISYNQSSFIYYNLSDGPQLFRLNGQAVPEPSSLMLLAGGGICSVMVYSRRRASK